MGKANYVQRGQSIDHTPGADLAEGTVVDLGGLGFMVGIARTPILANEGGSLETEGVFDLEKVGGGGVTFALGAEVFWDTVGQTAVAAAGANIIKVGVCVKAAVDNDTRVLTKINR